MSSSPNSIGSSMSGISQQPSPSTSVHDDLDALMSYNFNSDLEEVSSRKGIDNFRRDNLEPGYTPFHVTVQTKAAHLAQVYQSSLV